MTNVDDDSWDDELGIDIADDNRQCTISATFIDRWLSIPTRTPKDEDAWAQEILVEQGAPQQVVARQARYLVAMARWARDTVLPGTDLIAAFHPEVDGPVVAFVAFSVVPREYFEGPLEERVRTLHAKGGTPVRPDEVSLVPLEVGDSARLRAMRARAGKKRIFRGSMDQIFEGVTYLVQPSCVDDFRVVINSWWEPLELGDILATHIDKMAASLKLRVTLV